jgi:hypothetical protein
MTEEQGKTPRCDAIVEKVHHITSDLAEGNVGQDAEYINADDARDLERELSAALVRAEQNEDDAERWRHFRDEMDESSKLHMIATGCNVYDSTVDKDKRSTDQIKRVVENMCNKDHQP